MTKFTKIIATIGPSSDSVATIKKMHKEGMNIARLNFSHGNHGYFKKVIKNIRKVSPEIAIMVDTKGPEIRTGGIKGNSVKLVKGQLLELTSKKVIGDNKRISVSYPAIYKVDRGTTIFLDDGLIELKVIKKRKSGLVVRIANSGIITPSRKVTIRGHHVEVPFFSKKDKQDILFSIKNNVDFIAASFVRNSKDVIKLKELLKKHKSSIRIISKIENPSAVKNIREIIDESDGVMVARGDLGVEMPLEKIPRLQFDIIRICNHFGQPVVVATQMLESMKDNAQPTRAEVNDVAQAIIQGTDAVMLSGETTVGKYPVGSVRIMATIAKEYDPLVKHNMDKSLKIPKEMEKMVISSFITRVAAFAQKILDVDAIIAPTVSGFTARKVSRYKPQCPILAFTNNIKVVRQLQISWGVFPTLEKKQFKSLYEMVHHLVRVCYQKKLINKKDRVVLTSGHHLAGISYTNLFEILSVKRILERKTRRTKD
ncbi:MAG: pyruvate kinase [bacterium]|nr:pyruvate kinase [bacterium]